MPSCPALLLCCQGLLLTGLRVACPQGGLLEKYGVELIGAKLPSINKAEDRELFKQAMKKIGLKTPPSGTVETWEDALKVTQKKGSY